jgi:drug/metabolite transporter (DMT)-like permease
LVARPAADYDPRVRGLYPALLVAVPVVVWGCTPRVTAEAGPLAGPLTLTMLRAAPTAVALLVALPLLRARLPRDRSLWLWTAVTGLLMVTVFLTGFTEGIIHAGPGNAIVLATTAPFWVVILGRLFLGERPGMQAVAGLLVGFAGVVMIVWSQVGGDSGGTELVVGMALALAAALGWGIGTLIVKELVVRRPDVDLVGLTAGQYVVGGAAMLAISFASEGSGGAHWSSGKLWLCVAFISVVGCAVATIAYFEALRVVDVTRVTAATFLSPVIAVLLEIVLGNAPSGIVLAGMAVTIVGVAVVTTAPQTTPLAAAEPA